jgi:alpha-glucosidase (family GH31 glycosyl hydrolase)
MSTPTRRYACEIDAAPFALRVTRLGQVVLATGARAGDGLAAPGAFKRRGNWFRVTGVTAEEHTPAGAVLTCATSDPHTALRLTLVYQEDGLTVRWETVDGEPCELLGDAFTLASAGHWYGHGYHEPQWWPLDRGTVANDPFLCNNVQSPIWLTSRGAGIVIPTEELLTVAINGDGDGLFRVGMHDTAVFEYRILVGDSIVDAFRRLLAVVGIPSRIPPKAAFDRPIYSTWTQYPRYITQEKVLAFAHAVVDAGLPAGILEIDEKYQPSFGEISFDPAIFPDPAGMLAELQQLGFLATLWTSPFINTDSPAYEELWEMDGLVTGPDGKPAHFTWWAGEAGLLDVTSPAGEAWYAEKLGEMRDLGFVGFKFDGGDGKYTPPFATAHYHVPQRPQGYANRYLEFIAKHFPDFSESRVAWTVQREGLITREGGKDTRWGLDNGLHALITQGMTQAILGYPYLICDMVPGRVQTRFADAPLPTDELFVRWTEASAFTPILQFSYGPWNYGADTLAAVRAYAHLHGALGDYLYACAQQAHRDGTPIVRPLFFHDLMDALAYTIDDQFLLGPDILVAPVVTEGATTRDVYLPQGTWRDLWTGQTHAGRATLAAHPAPCPGLPLFLREGSAWTDHLAAIFAAHLPNIARGSVPTGVTTATYSATLQRTI